MSEGTTLEYARNRLALGAKFPFDASDEWWNGDAESPPGPTDWAHSAARGVLSDLRDRRGIKQGFDGLDEETRTELVTTLAGIIRLAAPKGQSTAE